MIKARFSERQSAVKISETTNKYYIFLCLNENKIVDDDTKVSDCWEYDYEEIVTDKSTIDIDDVQINPDKYLNYNEIDILSKYKKEKISESKTKLESYLAMHPLYSTAKYEDGRFYSVTAEKQRQLTSKISMYNLYSQLSMPYNLLKWNDTGDVCENWTIEQLTQLAMEIDAYVTPLVSKQQTYEKEMQNAESLKTAKQIILSFDN